MHRSASATRASDFYMPSSSSSSSSSSSKGPQPDVADELPMYDPLSEFAKKEKLRMKFAENAVHVIPLVLVICAAILWFCSNPDFDMVHKDAARVEGLKIDADLDVAHTMEDLLTPPDLDDMDSIKLNTNKMTGRYSRT